MNFNLLIIISVVLVLVSGCSSEERIHFYNSDKSQCLTVIDSDGHKFIFNKKVSSLKRGIKRGNPYIELDLANVTQSGHAIFVCWKNSENPLKVLCPEATFIKNLFNDKEVILKRSLNKDERGIPTAAPFHDEKCFEFGYESKTVFPVGHAIYEKF